MTRSFTLIALLAMLLPGPEALAGTDTDYRIEFVTLQGDVLQMLVSESRVRTRCLWGRHGCSEKDLGATLYRVDVPASQRFTSLRELRRHWHKMREAVSDDSFRGLEIAGDDLVATGGEGAVACPARKSDACPMPPAVQGRASYRQFVVDVAKEMRGPDHSAVLQGPVGSRYIVAMAQYASSERPQVARYYDVQRETSALVQVQLQADEAAEMMDVTTSGDDLLILVKLTRFSPQTRARVSDRYTIYSVRDQRWSGIAPLAYPPADHLVWDAPRRHFIEVDWDHRREGVELVRRDY